MPFICPICRKEHTELPHVGCAAPFHWCDDLDRDPTSLLTEDLCIIENRDFFVHGVIEIPVHDYEHGFGWGVWVSHKRENFEIYREHFDTPEIGPYFGWLCTEIDYFVESTLLLKTTAHYRGDGLRPRIVVHESEHPLYLQQRDGISLAEAWEIVHFYDRKHE
jgi:hypothetical protein